MSLHYSARPVKSAPRVRPAARRFGAGLLAFVPSFGTAPYTARDAAWQAASNAGRPDWAAVLHAAESGPTDAELDDLAGQHEAITLASRGIRAY
jgi:hypothetical protein